MIVIIANTVKIYLKSRAVNNSRPNRGKDSISTVKSDNYHNQNLSPEVITRFTSAKTHKPSIVETFSRPKGLYML